MIKKIRNILMSFVLFGTFAAPLATVAVVQAQITECSGIQNCLDNGADNTDNTVGVGTPEDRINKIVKTVINLFSFVVGIVSVVMIIIGGLKYITSGGDAGNITSAKNTILYAIIGLIIVAFAQLVVRFVLGRVTK